MGALAGAAAGPDPVAGHLVFEVAMFWEPLASTLVP